MVTGVIGRRPEELLILQRNAKDFRKDESQRLLAGYSSALTRSIVLDCPSFLFLGPAQRVQDSQWRISITLQNVFPQMSPCWRLSGLRRHQSSSQRAFCWIQTPFSFSFELLFPLCFLISAVVSPLFSGITDAIAST